MIKLKKDAKEKDLKQIKKDEINFDTLSAYLLIRYHGRARANPQIISLLAAELVRADYRTISELDNSLRNTDKAVEKVEEDVSGLFHNVGMVRNALSIVDEIFDKNRILNLRRPNINRSDYRKFVDAS